MKLVTCYKLLFLTPVVRLTILFKFISRTTFHKLMNKSVGMLLVQVQLDCYNAQVASTDRLVIMAQLKTHLFSFYIPFPLFPVCVPLHLFTNSLSSS